jgi:glycosyltransferase involved in cell wall biosynthesis
LWKKADLSLKNWHENWGRILDCSDEIRCFSQSTANYYKKFFSSISEKLTVVPHANQTSSEEKLQVYTDSLNICVVGAISQIKGSIVISALAKKLKKSHPDARIYIIGSWFGADLHSNMCLVSPYDKHHLLDILHYLKATMCLFPTICPETFSYVISELKELDAPIISFNLGAQGERLASYPKGVLVDEISADAAYDAVVKLYENLKSAKRRD